MRRRSGSVACLVLLAVLAGCAGGTTPGGSASAQDSGEVVVFAAASLTETFTALGKQFESSHPGVRVVFNFGPSSGLAAQINAGAPADVFASASPQNMDQVVRAGATPGATVFARNVLQLAVPRGNPARITGIADLARTDVKVALCQQAVPCGAAAARVLASAGISVTPVTQEGDVKAVLTKVRLNEVDVGLVYVTDVRAAPGSVEGITIPEGINTSTSYPIATLNRASGRPAAAAFTSYVLSPTAAAVLLAAGFERP